MGKEDAEEALDELPTVEWEWAPLLSSERLNAGAHRIALSFIPRLSPLGDGFLPHFGPVDLLTKPLEASGLIGGHVGDIPHLQYPHPCPNNCARAIALEGGVAATTAVGGMCMGGAAGMLVPPLLPLELFLR